MKEALFILVVIAALFALTAFRYRKQIRTVLGVWRMITGARPNDGERQVEAEKPSGKLVNCARCSTWVPEDRAIRFPPNIYYCSRNCAETYARAS
jgi:hypothetical protein